MVTDGAGDVALLVDVVFTGDVTVTGGAVTVVSGDGLVEVGGASVVVVWVDVGVVGVGAVVVVSVDVVSVDVVSVDVVVDVDVSPGIDASVPVAVVSEVVAEVVTIAGLAGPTGAAVVVALAIPPAETATAAANPAPKATT